MPVDGKLTPDEMRRWNKFIDFAKSKGYSGLPELDHNEALRKKVFSEYNQANPDDKVSMDMVLPVQNEIQNYKKDAISNIQSGQGQFGQGVNQDNFMRNISQIDGIFGQKTSSWKFPQAYIYDRQKNQMKNLGFAPNVSLNQMHSAEGLDTLKNNVGKVNGY